MNCVWFEELSFLLIGAETGGSDVNIFNAATCRWSTASLSVARGYMAATSLPEFGLAIFAGGSSSSTSLGASLLFAGFSLIRTLNTLLLLISQAMLWISSMQLLENGALLLSVYLGVRLEPHRFQIMELRCSLAAVRLLMGLACRAFFRRVDCSCFA